MDSNKPHTTSFLQAVAADLYERHAEEVSELNIVFPTQRARLFFTDALAKNIKLPLWQPNYLSMEDVVKSISPLKQTDNYSLLIDLYKLYIKHKQSAETFDHFYFWGEILLNDFDTLDKYLVNAEMLFKNLAAQKTLEGDFSFLSEEQIRYIQSFWSSFDPKGESPLQQQFIEVWAALLPIYTDFKALLYNKGEAYEGMIYRDMAQRIERNELSDLSSQPYVFVGFNALNECEKALFRYLKSKLQATFYWDYDDYYMHDTVQEAGFFMRNNVHEFPSPQTFDIPSTFSDGKQITITSVPSDVLQAKTVAQLLTKMDAPLNRQTAIVLADENLLIPVLHSLPPNVDEVNVTMGYPLKQTPVYSLIELLIKLQRGSKTTNAVTRFYYKDVLSVLNHQYIGLLAKTDADRLKQDILTINRVYVGREYFESNQLLFNVFNSISDYAEMTGYLIDILTRVAQVHIPENEDENALRREYVYHVIKALNQLKKSVDEGGLPITLPVFLSLLRSVFNTLRIPFTGEPIKGLQVMGLLETRVLDFDNLIILSLNEGILPHAGSTPSFVPYHLRRGFNLPAVEQQEAIYAYYFYRLLQRAQNIQLLYSSKADEVRTGEMSRYLYQLKFESGHTITQQALTYQLSVNQAQPIAIEKSGEVIAQLKTYLSVDAQRNLSPSALSSYIKCPLQFYFKYIAHLSETDEVQEEVAANVFGSILHGVMETLYKPYLNQPLTTDVIKTILNNNETIYRLLDEGFAREFYNSDTLPADFADNGKLLITRDVLAKYVRGILMFDANHAPFTPISFEERVTLPYSFTLNNKQEQVKLSGFADRIDRYNGATRIIDYKTGGGKGKNNRLRFSGVASLFSVDPKERNSEAFQTFLYALMYAGDKPQPLVVMPALYFVRDMYDSDFTACLVNDDDKQTITDFTPYAAEFSALLNQCLASLFSPSVAFTQTTHTDICTKACAFNTICRR